MKFFIVVVLLAFANAGVIDTRPKCITIRTTVYEEEVLKQGVDSPYQLAIDHDTNTLFFSYTAKTTETFKLAYLSLKTNDYGIVRGIHGGFATAVNSKSHIVYMGGEDGIYKFNYDTKTATNLNIKNDVNIWQMFYKDGLYFTTYPNEKAFVYRDQEVVAIPELKDRAMVLAVKNDGSIVYSNSSGLFIYNKSLGTAINVGDYTVNGFSADIDGNIYFSTPSQIYYIHDKNNEIEELATLDNVYGVAVEANGNIIYANERNIIRLKPTKRECLDDLTVYEHKNILSLRA